MVSDGCAGRREAVTRWPGALAAVILLLLASGAVAQPAVEVPPLRIRAVDVLPADLLQGPNHQVAEEVVDDGYVNHYRVGSRFGELTAASTAMLRVRILEINAMTAMEQVESTSEFTTSFQASLKRNVQGIENLVTQPGEALQGAVSGVARLFDRANESLFGSSRSQAEGSRFQDVVGYAKTRREIAHQFGVDVYSSNALLQEHLSKLAQANYWGGMSVGILTAAVPGAPGAFLSVTGTTRLLNDVIATTPPPDLRRMNRQKLAAMRVDPTVADLFINNAVFTPRQQTVFVAALEEMRGTADRGAVVRFAVTAHNPDVAFYRQRMAEMYAGYARNVAPIQRFVPVGEFVFGVASGRAAIVCAPFDHLLWTEPVARVVDSLGRRARDMGLSAKEVWLTGTVTPVAREEFRRLGWTVREQSETQLWARR